jgi:hypothetical protein
MSTRNILIALGVLIIIVGGAYILRDKDDASVVASPTPTGTPLPTGTFDMGGAIQSVTSGNITIRGADGVVTEISTPSSTAYYDESSRVIARTSLTTGQWVTARITRNSAGVLNATFVMKWYAPGTVPAELEGK